MNEYMTSYTHAVTFVCVYMYCSGSAVEPLQGQFQKQLRTLTMLKEQVVTAPTVDGGDGVVGQDTSKCYTFSVTS